MTTHSVRSRSLPYGQLRLQLRLNAQRLLVSAGNSGSSIRMVKYEMRKKKKKEQLRMSKSLWGFDNLLVVRGLNKMGIPSSDRGFLRQVSQ